LCSFLVLLLETWLVSIPLQSQSPPKLFSLQPSPTPAASPSPAPSPAIAAISLPQIADAAEELDQQLRGKSKDLESAPELRLADSQAKANAGEIVERADQVDELLSGIPNMMQLQNEERYWQALAEEYENQRKLLTSRAARVEEKIRWLETEQARWKTTLDTVKGKSGLEVVEDRVQQALNSIQHLDAQFREQLNLILTLQNTISEQDRKIAVVAGKIDETLERLRGRLFQRDGYPLWAVRELRAVNQPASGWLALSAHRRFGGALNFLRANRALFAAATILYIFLLAIAIRLRKQVDSEGKRDVTIQGSQVFARPFSVALLVTLLATIGINASAPAVVSFVNKFTVITGALGLGIGFGLQNIVSNFASGLIVLFERPIRINDTVEIGGITGIVRRIGARSSTVLTAQGAEVIFPNSNVLSNQVTNWTLSSTRRRVEVAVGVAYGTDPQVVLKMLTEIAMKNPHVLAYPPPQTMFLGFGDNALSFELTFWAAQSMWFELKSEIGLAVLRALRQAKIEIPYPQRDLHVRILQSLNKEEDSAISESAAGKKVVGL
jgi:small-conductance mechanosensitive channel